MQLQNLPLYTLRKEVSDLKKTVEAQGKALSEQGQAIGLIQNMLAEPPAPDLDDFDKWSLSKDAENHAGSYVAFVPGHGPIAISKNRRDLMDEIRNHPMGVKAGIGIVPCLTEQF